MNEVQTSEGKTINEDKKKLDKMGEIEKARSENETLKLLDTNYSDFHTIDWLRDTADNRMRQRKNISESNKTIFYSLYLHFDAMSGWICVFLVGFISALIAGVINIGTSFMKDLRDGVCLNAFWLNRQQCCWASNETFYADEECSSWFTWSRFFGMSGDPTDYSNYFVSYIIYTVWSLVFAITAGLLVKTFAPYSCGSGIPEIKTILSGYIIRGYLGKWTLLIKSICIMLAVASGLSLGKEGPFIHIACCIGNIISHVFPKYGKNEAKKREILSAASAAGVSLAFGAPIGGILFSLEEISYYFPLKTMWRSFFCALIAAFVLRSTSGSEESTLFYISHSPPWSLVELVPFIIMGIMGGLIGSIFIKANIALCRWRKTSKYAQYTIFEIVFVVLICSIISYPNYLTRMNSADLIQLLIAQCGEDDESKHCDLKPDDTNFWNKIVLLLIALLIKLIITIFTYGLKIPSGLFVPSMALGAIYGRIIGLITERLYLNNRNHWLFNKPCFDEHFCFSPGIYTMIGAASGLGGMTRMTVSLVVIMSELTGNVNYIIPLMVAIMTSKWVGDAFGKGGIYDEHIRLNEYPFLDNKQELNYISVAKDVLEFRRYGELTVLPKQGMTVEDVEFLVAATSFNGFPVVTSNAKKYLTGYIRRRDMQIALNTIKISYPEVNGQSLVFFTDNIPTISNGPPSLKLNKMVDLSPITVTDETPINTIIEMFRKLGLRHICVIHDGIALGIITKKDILNFINYLDQKPKHFSLF